jgi:putative cell wall-binding protein
MDSRQGRRVRAGAIVGAAALVGAVVMGPSASATGGFTMTRIAGSSRYATAAQIAIDSYGEASGIILATGETFPDALSASFLAGYVNSPILLAQRTSIPQATLDAMATLGVKEVVILGGTAAISTEVENQLKETYDVVRLSGQDRFATAANVALAVNAGDIGELDGERTAFLTYGYGFADALSVGPLAFAGRFPILLNGKGALGTPTKVALDRLDITHVVIVGGIISAAAQDELTSLGISSERIAGPDRFATATAVADFALARLHFVAEKTDLARGIDPSNPDLGFADALAGSVAAGKESVPLLLTHPTELSKPTLAWLEAHAPTLTDGDILGGESAVSKSVESAATAAARRVVGYVSAIDPDAHTYTLTFGEGDPSTTVTYASSDAFVVNGATATQSAFLDALTVGDHVRFTTAGGARHVLTDGEPTTTTSSTTSSTTTTAP